MSTNVTNGLMYVRQLRQRTITLDWMTGNCCLSTDILTLTHYQLPFNITMQHILRSLFYNHGQWVLRSLKQTLIHSWSSYQAGYQSPQATASNMCASNADFSNAYQQPLSTSSWFTSKFNPFIVTPISMYILLLYRIFQHFDSFQVLFICKFLLDLYSDMEPCQNVYICLA